METIDAVDRISELPEHLQQRILSSLPFKDAVRTSVLCKRWKNVWIIAITTLKFDHASFFRLKTCNKSNVDDEFNARKEEYLFNFFEQTLRIRHSQMVSLENLVLHVPRFYGYREIASSLDRCIRYALECSVKRLDLKLGGSLQYNLPETVFAAKSITYLCISGCKFESCTNLNLCCLKILTLQSVWVDDQIIQNLIANCPVIEDLRLSSCYQAKGTLQICGLVNPNLVRVEVWFCEFERVEIEALGLQSFTFYGSYWRPCEINVSKCKNMNKLSITGSPITDKLLHDHISNLPFLEKLSLDNCKMLQSITIVSCRLKHLVVHSCSKLVKVEINDLNLSTFDYAGENTISFSSNALALWRVVISLYPENVDILWYFKLVEFLGMFNNAKVLKFDTNIDKFVIVPKELRKSLLPPLYNFKTLTLKCDSEMLSKPVEEIVDGVVWFSSHPVTCHASANCNNCLSFEFTQEKILKNVDGLTVTVTPKLNVKLISSLIILFVLGGIWWLLMMLSRCCKIGSGGLF